MRHVSLRLLHHVLDRLFVTSVSMVAIASRSGPTELVPPCLPRHLSWIRMGTEAVDGHEQTYKGISTYEDLQPYSSSPGQKGSGT